MGKANTTKTVEGAVGAKRTGRQLVRAYAMPVGIAVAAGILGGVVAVNVLGVTVTVGVATGLVTAVATFQKTSEALSKLRP